MNTQFFASCTTVEDVKKLYRTLAMQHHPDRGGDTATMQALNAAYHIALKMLDGQFSKADNDKDQGFTYRYDEDKEQEVMDKVAEVIASGILDSGVDCYIIGTWLWATGDTKPHRNTLGREGLGFSWHPKKVAWYWRSDNEPRRRFRGKGDLTDIAAKYGAEKVVANGRKEAGLVAA